MASETAEPINRRPPRMVWAVLVVGLSSESAHRSRTAIEPEIDQVQAQDSSSSSAFADH